MYNIESLHYASNTRQHLAKYLYFNTVRRVLQDHARRTTDVLLDYGDRCVLHLRSVGDRRRPD